MLSVVNTTVPQVIHEPIRLAVLISGGGTTLLNLYERVAAGTLRAKIVTVLCSNIPAFNRLHARGLDGIETHLVARCDYDNVENFSDVVFDRLRQADCDLICLGGFLSRVAIPDDFADRLLNIHPALLPAFGGKGMYGHHVHEAVLAANCKISGCTVHFADQTYDTGPIILQRTCPVYDDDTPEMLAARVFEQEREAYPQAIKLIAEARLSTHNQIIRIESSDTICRARRWCMQAHARQQCTGGQPYYTHPIAVAEILRSALPANDPELIAAACLHDVVEHTSVTLEQIHGAFGSRVANLVEPLAMCEEPTMLSTPDHDLKHKYRQLAERTSQLPNGAKMIKIADCLDNMRQIEDRPFQDRRQYAITTGCLLEALQSWPMAMDNAMAEIQQIIARQTGPAASGAGSAFPAPNGPKP